MQYNLASTSQEEFERPTIKIFLSQSSPSDNENKKFLDIIKNTVKNIESRSFHFRHIIRESLQENLEKINKPIDVKNSIKTGNLIIRCEEDVLAILNYAIDNKIEYDNLNIEFKGWPLLVIHYEGSDFDSSITTSIASAIRNLQITINQIFCFFVYGSFDTRFLKKQDKDFLNLKFKITSGSTEILTDLKKFCAYFFKKIKKNKSIITLLISLILTQPKILENYLDYKVKSLEITKKAQIEEKRIEKELKTLFILDEHFKTVTSQNKDLINILKKTNKTHEMFLSSIKNNESVNINKKIRNKK